MKRLLERLANGTIKALGARASEYYIKYDMGLDADYIAETSAKTFLWAIRKTGTEVLVAEKDKERFTWYLNETGYERVYLVRKGRAHRISNHVTLNKLIQKWGHQTSSL